MTKKVSEWHGIYSGKSMDSRRCLYTLETCIVTRKLITTANKGEMNDIGYNQPSPDFDPERNDREAE